MIDLQNKIDRLNKQLDAIEEASREAPWDDSDLVEFEYIMSSNLNHIKVSLDEFSEELQGYILK